MQVLLYIIDIFTVTSNANSIYNASDYCYISLSLFQKVVSTLEPAFVTPKVIENVGQEQQLIAFDTVNVITKGSILGFIDVQRHEFDGEVMTANMFPVLDITFIEQSQIQIELRM